MSGLLRQSYKNWIDSPDTIITPSSEANALVAANVAQMNSSLLWRVILVSDSAYYIEFDFGKNVPIQALAIQFFRSVTPNQYGNNTFFDPTDTLRFRLSTVAAGDGEVYDSGVLNSAVVNTCGTFVQWLNTEYSARYLRIDIDAISQLSRGYCDIKRIWAGPCLTIKRGFTYGIKWGWFSNSVISRPQRGTNIFVAAKESKRQGSFTIDWVDNATERDLLDEFEAYMTTAGEFLIGRTDMTTGRGDMFCLSTQVNGLTDSNLGISTKSWLIEENV